MRPLLFILASIASFQSFASQLYPKWKGKIDSKKMFISFEFRDSRYGKYAIFNLPALGFKNGNCNYLKLDKDSVKIDMASYNMRFEGMFNEKKDSIFGVIDQNGKKEILHLGRDTTTEIVKMRSQTPRPPFAYRSDSVEYESKDQQLHYGATLSMPAQHPNDYHKYHAVILITGSGLQDRDETIFDHKPFAVLAEELTRKGIAVLRVDDRAIGRSSGSLKDVTSADFAMDVMNSLDYLKGRTEIDPKHIGLLGHSEGGVIAPMVAARRKDVAFIVTWGAPIVGGLQVNTEQNAYSLQKSGFKKPAVDAFKDLHVKMLQTYKITTDTQTLNKSIGLIYNDWKRQQSDTILKQLMVKNDFIVGQNVYAMYTGLYNVAWMRYFIVHDFAADLAKVKCPVLAVNGEKDTQVDADTNLTLISDILKKNGNKDFQVVKIKGANHVLQTSTTGDVTEYGKIEETMGAEGLSVIVDWMVKH